MKGLQLLSVMVLASFLCIAAAPSAVLADVEPGDRIDSTNWQKVEGLLPESVLEWVKKGEFILDIGELEYDPGPFKPSYCLEATPKNEGKYDVDEKGDLIDKSTGKHPAFMLGLPFPTIDMDDPMAAYKYMWNQFIHRDSWGNARYSYLVTWVNDKGVEREVAGQYRSVVFTACPANEDIPNPDHLQMMDIVTVQKPYDLAGTSIMTWRYMTDRPDGVFAYVPAIRRVRRLSPANRSDAFVGSDFCQDDICTYDGKISAFDWKVLGTGEVLAPYPTKAPDRVVLDNGQWKTTADLHGTVWGYEDKAWDGAKWAPTNSIWVKRPVLILEGTPKDTYYNYGKQIFYVDPEVFLGYYKVIYDRSGEYWKTLVVSYGGGESADKTSMQLFFVYYHLIVDDRTHHASVNEAVSPEKPAYYLADNPTNDYSLAGFQKFCK